VSILANSPNHFLRSLSRQDAELLQPLLKLVELPSGTVLYKADEIIARVYFPYAGIVSYVVNLSAGKLVEAGLIGRNSAVGIGALLDGATAINEAIVQVAMSGAAAETRLLRRSVAGSDTLRALFMRHEEAMIAQVQQIAACNALHSLEERLSRWLLQARDLLNADVIPLTQDFLSQMLGVHRSSLTLVARRLQEAGLIDYHRGSIRIRDIEALKDASCECYDAINAHFLGLIGWSPDFDAKALNPSTRR
jgi:CRP-like cAMP-binding protein